MDAQPLQHIHSAAPGVFSDPGPLGVFARHREKDTVGAYAPNTNIVVYGETDADKSPVINLIAGQELAHASSDFGHTFQYQRHIIDLNGMPCALWDTTGLDEGTKGTAPAAQAERNLGLLLQELTNTGGIHLVIYCIRAGRFRNTHQHNYDLFYITVCRKKVPVALVVTGLEHQQGEMETWWAANEEVLRQSGMLFDAHACVTTLDVGNHLIQQRRSDSRRLLRELVFRYSILPPWKIGPSFTLLVLPVFRAVLRRMMVVDRAEQSTTIRKVITCDMVSPSNASTPAPIRLSSDIPLCATRKECVQIEGRSFDFVHVDKRVLQMHTSQEQHAGPMDVGSGAGVLVFYTSPLGNAAIPTEEADMLEVFYKIAGGQMCPMIVALRGCDDVERAIRKCRDVLALRHANVQAYFTPFLNQRLTDMIDRLCVEYVEVNTPSAYKACWDIKQWLVTAVEAVISMGYMPFGWRRGRVTSGTTSLGSTM